MICPICGAESLLRTCSTCGNSLEGAYALVKASGRFYNEGLKAAQNHCLGQARAWLKKAIVYNPRNVDAMNLLGVVYTQTGEIGAAMRIWQKSTRVDEVEATNAAHAYLKRAARNTGRAAQMKEATRLYNQALGLLHADQADTALAHLKKAVSFSENYVAARELLALCFIQAKQFDKAKALLAEVEKIDAQDPNVAYLTRLAEREHTLYLQSEEGQEALAQQAQIAADATAQAAAAEEAAQTLSADASGLQGIPGLTRKRSLRDVASWKAIRNFFRQNTMAVQVALWVCGLVIGVLFTLLLIQ